MQELDEFVAETVRETQATGRHPNVHPELLNLYTTAVPWGIAMIVDHPGYEASRLNMDIDEAVAQLIELVVPIAGGQRRSSRSAVALADGTVARRSGRAPLLFSLVPDRDER